MPGCLRVNLAECLAVPDAKGLHGWKCLAGLERHCSFLSICDRKRSQVTLSLSCTQPSVDSSQVLAMTCPRSPVTTLLIAEKRCPHSQELRALCRRSPGSAISVLSSAVDSRETLTGCGMRHFSGISPRSKSLRLPNFA